MVLTSENTALITGTKLDELNDDYDRDATQIEVWTQPIDPETDPVLLCERKVAREI
jgi:hypothetical protein